MDDLNISAVNGEVFDFNLESTLKDCGMTFDKADFIAYKGSLTTPPCTEVVNWHVLKNPALIDYKTEAYILNSYYKANSSFAGLNGNNRIKQNVNGRVIKINYIDENSSIGLSYIMMIVFISLSIIGFLICTACKQRFTVKN